jgi:acyl-CoA synthetase (AMP-forming)/AMP-acid ligase II
MLINSCGRINHRVESQVAIVDPDSFEHAKQDRIGEMWVYSASKGLGYYGRPEATEETFNCKVGVWVYECIKHIKHIKIIKPTYYILKYLLNPLNPSVLPAQGVLCAWMAAHGRQGVSLPGGVVLLRAHQGHHHHQWPELLPTGRREVRRGVPRHGRCLKPI